MTLPDPARTEPWREAKAAVDRLRLEAIEEASDLAIPFLVGVRQHARDYPPDFNEWPQDRKNEYFAEQVRAYERKARSKPNGGGDPEQKHDEKRIKIIMGSDIRPEAIAWLWPDWLAHGKLHILAGRPGTLKTTTTISFAAIVTIGGQWPDGSPAAAGNVIIWSGEDAIKDTLLPRLIAAGGDPARVAFIGGVSEDGKKRSFDPAIDMDALADCAPALETSTSSSSIRS